MLDCKGTISQACQGYDITGPHNVMRQTSSVIYRSVFADLLFACQHSAQFIFADNRHTELRRFVKLGAGTLAGDQVARVLTHRIGHFAAMSLDEVTRRSRPRVGQLPVMTNVKPASGSASAATSAFACAGRHASDLELDENLLVGLMREPVEDALRQHRADARDGLQLFERRCRQCVQRVVVRHQLLGDHLAHALDAQCGEQARCGRLLDASMAAIRLATFFSPKPSSSTSLLGSR